MLLIYCAIVVAAVTIRIIVMIGTINLNKILAPTMASTFMTIPTAVASRRTQPSALLKSLDPFDKSPARD